MYIVTQFVYVISKVIMSKKKTDAQYSIKENDHLSTAFARTILFHPLVLHLNPDIQSLE